MTTKMSIWRRRAARAAVGGVATYAGLLLIAALGYRLLLFPRPKSGLEPLLNGTELLKLDAEGVPVVALWGAPPTSTAPVIVFFHGNGDELVELVPLGRRFQDEGFGFLFVEYPGYGLAGSGETSETNIYRVADRALSHLAVLGIDKSRVVLMGHSLGTGVAIEMATRGYGDRVILVSPYTSMVDMASRFAPFLPARWYMSDRFESLDKAPRVHQAALVVHGDHDALIPVAMGKRLGSALPSAQLEIIEGGTHGDLFRRKDDKLLRLVVTFSRSVGSAPERDAIDGRAKADEGSGAGNTRAN